MENKNAWQGLSEAAAEEWFLDRLTDSIAAFEQLLAAIIHFQTVQQPDKAETCAGLLQDALIKQSADEQLLLLLEKRVSWQSNPEDYAASCFHTLAVYFKGRNLMQLYLAACGLKNGVEPREALRRLRVLHDLKPGKYCYEATWGIGRVAGTDEFERQIIIDFEKKKAHCLSFNYAAETVQPLEDDHFLALKLRAPENFSRWLNEKPSEAVRAMLNQFGEMTINHLRSLSVSLLMNEDKWSSFWAAARAELSSDPLVQMPASRNDPVRLLKNERQFDEKWRNNFVNERDPDRIFAEIEALFRCQAPENLGAELKAALAGRLVFLANGAGMQKPEIIVQVLLTADKADIDLGKCLDVSIYSGEETFCRTLDSLPIRMIKSFLQYLEGKNLLPADKALLNVIPRLPAPVLNELAAYYRNNGRENEILAVIRNLMQAGTVSVEMISWAAGNYKLVFGNKILLPQVFAQTALALLQTAAAAGRRKDISQLRSVFTKEVLLKEIFQAMEAGYRFEFCRRLNSLAGLNVSEKKAVAAKIILLFPDLASAFGAGGSTAAISMLTSLRSYRERQAQLEKIINEEIPRNSKEIGVARSYGDLRENAEYKAAREMQGILMRRKAELEKMLGEVKSTDFAGFPHEAAGIGASVELTLPDGGKETYHILGEWDSDEKFRIISCRSRLALALNGRRAGDMVEIPGENSPVNCVIESVRELPLEIRAWINGG